jgi:diaminohydroxyphosphoribosylaminopyrimidine deaminase/5-amino-6-(5-phosphoribosylamino)uracil reductase
VTLEDERPDVLACYPHASLDHQTNMRAAMAEAELARGKTGDNPWVGCVIVDGAGVIVARGHTQGPGEDHAEIEALREFRAHGSPVAEATLYSTLEPCSFHGRTPACARVIVESGIPRVIIGMRDPHPRVDGEGARILQRAGIEVVEGVCEDEVRKQLGAWVFAHHPHEPKRRALALQLSAEAVAEVYAVSVERVRALLG